MRRPEHHEFLTLFPATHPFSGPAVIDPSDPDSDGINPHLLGRRWMDVPTDDLLMLQMNLRSFSDPALTYFLPAFVYAAMHDLNQEELDYSVLQFIATDSNALIRLGYTAPQLDLLLTAIEYIHAHSSVQFDGLDQSIASYRARLRSLV